MKLDLKLISSCVKIPRYLLPHMPGLTKRNSRELKAKVDLQKINLVYVHQILIRIKRTLTIPIIPIQTQTLIIIMMILMIVPQIIHLATRRKSRNLMKNTLNQRIQKMKSRVISNLKQNPPTMKNLQTDTLEEVVLTLPMKNPWKEVVTATNPTKDQRVIPTIRLKNLNQFQNLVHHYQEDHLGSLNP